MFGELLVDEEAGVVVALETQWDQVVFQCKLLQHQLYLLLLLLSLLHCRPLNPPIQVLHKYLIRLLVPQLQELVTQL